MLSYLIHARLSKISICAERSFNNSWRRLPGYLQGQQNHSGVEHPCKTEEQNTLTNAQQMPY